MAPLCGAIFVASLGRIEKPFWRGAPDAQSEISRSDISAARLGSRVPPSLLPSIYKEVSLSRPLLGGADTAVRKCSDGTPVKECRSSH
jgi:hypothetical protein